ncbi:homeobox protein TGIF2LX [Equus quagga]|uniref:homeobox protein TGIF2LX n=1 Tax=Equus quagga TaxID=89248 RepID=UPI001EE16D26|nr:homeobox protein TGIF2LX [Equus quagga]
MEAGEESPGETDSWAQGASLTSNDSSDTDDDLASLAGKRKRKGYLPPEAVKILRDWLYEHRFKVYPSQTEKRMLSEHTGLSLLQISNWFSKDPRRVLPEVLKDAGNDPNQITMYQQKDKTADVTDHPDVDPSMQAKSGPKDPDKMQCQPLRPLPVDQESGEKPLDPELAPDQKLAPEAMPNMKVKFSASGPLVVSSCQPVSAEECKDFSNFQLLVEAALQKAAELELQKQQEPNP